MNIEERVARLEKLTEKLLHEHELCGLYIPRLADVIERYLKIMPEYRTQIETFIRILRGEIGNIDTDMQKHFKSHSDKKRKSKYD